MTSPFDTKPYRKTSDSVSTHDEIYPLPPVTPDYSYGFGRNTLDGEYAIRLPEMKWAVMSATGTQAVNGGSKIAFNTFDGNDAAMFDDANDSIVITKNGTYQIVGQIYCGLTGLVYSGISIDVNGVQEAIEYTQVSTGVDRAMRNVSWIGKLSVGDVVSAT